MDKEIQKNLLELVKRNYEEIAADFDMTRKKYLWPELIKLTSTVKDGDRVLDVGCGNGRLLQAFVEKKISYLGVDSSEKLIESAKKNVQAVIPASEPESSFSAINKFLDCRVPVSSTGQATPAMTNKNYASRNDIRFQVADILELDKLPEKDFDYVFCIAVLHHLPGEALRVEALKQMKNKLNKNGKIVLTVWNLWSQPKFRKLIFKYGLIKLIGKNKLDFGDILFDWKNNQGKALSQRYYHACNRFELGKTAAKAGLKPEKLYYDKYNYYLILADK